MMYCVSCLLGRYEQEVKSVVEGRYEATCDTCQQPALCFSINPERAKGFKVNYSRVRYLKRRAEGKCVNCAKPVSHYSTHCDNCHLKLMEYRRKKMGHNRWRPGGRGRKPFVTPEAAEEVTQVGQN